MDYGSLDFSLPQERIEVQVAEDAIAPDLRSGWEWIFNGGVDSLVSWCVGSAEGTRTAFGGYNRAYQGHTDPGNRVWNMGTFSYQHGASTPQEADEKQLVRLHGQVARQQQQAANLGLEMTLEETLNGADLLNQSPTSGLGGPTSRGYVTLLVDATLLGLNGDAAILWARVASYLFPKGHARAGRWNAPGLGNTTANVERDQKRRMARCSEAIAAWQSLNPLPGVGKQRPVEQSVEQVVEQVVEQYGALSFDFP